MKRFVSLMAGSVLVFAAQAALADSVYFKAPVGFAGTGCKAGSISVSGENTDTVSLLFDSYDAGNGVPSASGLQSAACSFSMPIHVPQGFQASVVTIDWMGRASGNTTLKRKYFIAGQPNQPWQIDNYNSDFMANDSVAHASVATGCKGGEFQMRINSNISADPGSYIAVDTADLQNRVIFKLQWKPC